MYKMLLHYLKKIFALDFQWYPSLNCNGKAGEKIELIFRSWNLFIYCLNNKDLQNEIKAVDNAFAFLEEKCCLCGNRGVRMRQLAVTQREARWLERYISWKIPNTLVATCTTLQSWKVQYRVVYVACWKRDDISSW